VVFPDRAPPYGVLIGSNRQEKREKRHFQREKKGGEKLGGGHRDHRVAQHAVRKGPKGPRGRKQYNGKKKDRSVRFRKELKAPGGSKRKWRPKAASPTLDHTLAAKRDKKRKREADPANMNTARKAVHGVTTSERSGHLPFWGGKKEARKGRPSTTEGKNLRLPPKPLGEFWKQKKEAIRQVPKEKKTGGKKEP